jgi:putative FmdB family regulatory protein
MNIGREPVMPTYDYECGACGHRFEELQSFTDSPLTKCPTCKKNKLTRLFGGGGAIIFKGGGFYETDYRRAGESNNENADAGKSETETKAEAKTENKTEKNSETKSDTKAESPPSPPPPPASGNNSAGKSDGKGGKGGGKKAK